MDTMVNGAAQCYQQHKDTLLQGCPDDSSTLWYHTLLLLMMKN